MSLPVAIIGGCGATKLIDSDQGFLSGFNAKFSSAFIAMAAVTAACVALSPRESFPAIEDSLIAAHENFKSEIHKRSF